jgi:CheY-like chemotaxis protein
MTAVLIADDEPVSRRLLQATLQRWGYDVEVAHDGQEALESSLRDTAPRLAVLDCTRSLEQRNEGAHRR